MDRALEPLQAFSDAFRNPALRRLELAWAGANLGTWAYAVAVAVFAYDHGGALAVGVVGFGRWGVAALLSPWLALLADRYPRRRVMVTADLVRAAALALATATVEAGGPPLLVYVLTGLVAAAASAFHPAEAALRPSLVRDPEELVAANVVSSSIASIGTLGGPALGGLLLVAGGAGTVFAVAAGLLLWSAALVFSIRVDEGPPPARPEGESVTKAAFAGFAAIVADGRLRVVMGLLAAELLVNGLMMVLVVVLALRLVHLGEAGVGWLNSALGVGGVVGAAVAAALVGRRRLGGNLAVGLVLFGAPLAAAAVWTKPAAVLVLLGVAGVGGTVADVAAMTLLQRAAPEAILARVFGVLETVILVTLGVGSLLAPLLIDAIGARPALVASGLFLPVLVAVLWRPLAAIDRGAHVPERQLELLRGVPMFAPLAPPELERLAGSLERVAVEARSPVFLQGEAGDRFYIVDSGHAAIEIEGTELVTAGPGDFFGEIALLRDTPRTATVRALEPLELYGLDRDVFVAVVTGYASSREAAEAIVAGRLTSMAGA
ncbi:MAG: MFS transporter [Gaiellaceae bacterium]